MNLELNLRNRAVFPVQAGKCLSVYSNILPNSTFMAISDIFIAIISLQKRAPLHGMVVFNFLKSFEISLILGGGVD
jgi:hypothetical protein